MWKGMDLSLGKNPSKIFLLTGWKVEKKEDKF